MRVLIQRVLQGSVEVDDTIVGEIDKGLVVMVGVTSTDTEAEATQLAAKTAHLRIFEDDEGVMNRSLLDILHDVPGTAAVLSVSQFTLYASCRRADGRALLRQPGRKQHSHSSSTSTLNSNPSGCRFKRVCLAQR